MAARAAVSLEGLTGAGGSASKVATHTAAGGRPHLGPPRGNLSTALPEHPHNMAAGFPSVGDPPEIKREARCLL